MPEQIVISDDDEAMVRAAQMEEDEAVARSLQVRSFTCGGGVGDTNDSPVQSGNVLDALCSLRPSLTKKRHKAATCTIIFISRAVTG